MPVDLWALNSTAVNLGIAGAAQTKAERKHEKKRTNVFI